MLLVMAGDGGERDVMVLREKEPLADNQIAILDIVNLADFAIIRPQNICARLDDPVIGLLRLLVHAHLLWRNRTHRARHWANLRYGEQVQCHPPAGS